MNAWQSDSGKEKQISPETTYPENDFGVGWGSIDILAFCSFMLSQQEQIHLGFEAGKTTL